MVALAFKTITLLEGIVIHCLVCRVGPEHIDLYGLDQHLLMLVQLEFSIWAPPQFLFYIFLRSPKPRIQGLLRLLQMINAKENGCLPNLKSQVIVPVGQRLLPDAVLNL